MSTDATLRTAAVLSFHKIGDPPADGWDTWNYISIDTFLGHLEQLQSSGYDVVELSAFLDGLENPRDLPERCALLTFDDGYRSMLTTVQPLLERFGHPAVTFLPTKFIGGVNEWDHGNEPEEPLCDWEELAELQRRGISVQSHGLSHRSFSELDLKTQQLEIQNSKSALEDRLGSAIECFAFPYGDDGREVDATELLFRSAGYRAAFLYKGGVCTLPTNSPFRLTRVPMGPDTNLSRWLGGAA